MRHDQKVRASSSRSECKSSTRKNAPDASGIGDPDVRMHLSAGAISNNSRSGRARHGPAVRPGGEGSVKLLDVLLTLRGRYFNFDKMPYDAFISYSTHDKAPADATCAALEASGIRCWIAPRDIVPGAEWGEAIILAINQCRVMILIFSANANESPQIRREVERAVSKGIPIIPFRIQDIAPNHSLEYFIGTVHWLDALTPPLEAHLRRLAETVKTLLQIDPTPPRIVTTTNGAAPRAAPSGSPNRRILAGISIACLIAAVAGVGVWRLSVAPAPPAETVSSPPPVAPPAETVSSPLPLAPPAAPFKAGIDPLLIGTFARDGAYDDYDWHFVYSIAADGTYQLVTTQDEYGRYLAANGQYRTVGSKTGRVRTGSYRAVGTAAIEMRSAAGTATFRPTQPIAPVNQTNPVMLGIWRATIVQGGVTWVLTIENNPDGTYHYQGRAEDSGSCTIAERQWRTTSAMTGQSNVGTYRTVDARTVEIVGSDGPALWHRQ